MRYIRHRTSNTELRLPEDFFTPRGPFRRARNLLRRTATSLMVIHAPHGLGPNLTARSVAAAEENRFSHVVFVPGAAAGSFAERLVAAATEIGQWLVMPLPESPTPMKSSR